GRNPQTGAPVQVKASTAMKFSSSSTLKTALNPNR
ncbi:MAG: HU family DNA-binding protein, partial [Acidimicrobiaceae bacterium]|nr:HU family DNA-binding protein [Acidimicrobiaceae bacterium]